MYDITVIGAGWAGFNAAIKAKELGLKVCLIESGPIGGTCLNRGCIPTKALIQSGKVFSLTKKSQGFGLETAQEARINFVKVQERKERIIQQLQQGIRFSLKGIDCLTAEAKILSNHEIQLASEVIKTNHIVVATGSKPIELPAFKFDSKRILSSDDTLNLREVPASLLIIGGGVIGCEFASLFSTLGTQVAIAEKMPQLLPGEDGEIAKKLEIIFKKKGIKVNTNTDAQTLDLNKYDLILVCVGRVPNTSGLEAERLGFRLERSRIIVDEYLRTSIPGIYAAGDCTGKIMLAHFAAYQGRIAASNIARPGSLVRADNVNIPSCIFTEPEIASVGMSEEAAKNKGIDVNVKKLDFLSSGMARILDETEGFIKIVVNARSDELVGASIIGPKATELVGILTLAVSAKLKSSQLADVVFAHPTLSESVSDVFRSSHAA